MAKISLVCQTRTQLGKAATRRARLHQSMAPAVIYGNKQEPLHVIIDQKKLYHACEDETFFSQVLELRVDGKCEEVVVRQVQRHPYKQQIMHMDFLRISQESAVSMSVPLHFENEESCIGVKQQGGKIFHELNEVQITCLPKDLPEFIGVDVTDLELGNALHLSDIQVPAGVTIPELERGEEHDVAIVRVSKPSVAALDESEKPVEGEDVTGGEEAAPEKE